MESVLPHELVELILERLAVNSLLRLKVVSKQWKSTIESGFFKERQYKQREQSGDPDVLMVSFRQEPGIDIESLRTLVLGSSSTEKILTPWEEEEKTEYLVSYSSCDGLVCLYYPFKSGFVVNPTTRWYRPLPLCKLQQLMIELGDRYLKLKHEFFKPGFGKDKSTGTYKPVWLYNSYEIGLENATTCEVFDFSTNAWRYVTPSAPYRVVGFPDPVFVDGSLHWFTECEETKVLSFDLHTEAFQVIAKAPFAKVHRYRMVMCSLDNRLCVSEMNSLNQVIWSFNSTNMTWHKMWSIDVGLTYSCFGVPRLCALLPLALFHGDKKKKNNKLLFYDRALRRTLVRQDHDTESYDDAINADSIGFPICFFQSLFSIL